MFFSDMLGEPYWQFLMPWMFFERKSSICLALNLCKCALETQNECVLSAGEANDSWLKYVKYV